MATIVESLTVSTGLITAGQSATIGTGLDLTGHILSCTVSPSSYTDEQAQDAVGTILTDTATIDFTYDDAANTISADVKANSLTAGFLHATVAGVLFGRTSIGAGAGEQIVAGTGITIGLGVVRLSSGDGTGLPLTTKGDIYVYGGSSTRLPVGTNGFALFADSTQTTGLAWRAIAAGDLPATVAYTDVGNTFTVGQVIFPVIAGTNTVGTLLRLKADSTGTPAAGFGVRTQEQLQSSTTSGREAAWTETTWVDATDATRKARKVFYVYDTAQREAFRIEASGTAALVGFFGAAAVAQQTGNLVTSLANLGLVTSGTVAVGNVTGGAALTKTDDTNVTLTLGGTPTTALLAATSLALGWTGTLSVARGGIGVGTLTNHGVLLGQGTSAVVATAVMTDGQLLVGQSAADPLPKSLTGDITLSAAGAVVVTKINGVALGSTTATAGNLLIGSGTQWVTNAVTGDVTITSAGVTAIGANKITDAMLRQSAGLSVPGRSANTTGNVADITAAADGDVLRRSGTTLGFGDVRPPQSAKTATFTADTKATVYAADVSGGSITANLPAASGNTGLTHSLYLSAAPGANTLTIDASTTETINGALTLLLYYQHDWVTVYCDGTNWRVMDDNRARPTAQVKLSADQSIANSTVVAVAWDAEDYDTQGMHDNATNNSRVTIKRPGKYLVVVFLQFEGATTAGADTGVRQALLYITGAADIDLVISAATATGEDHIEIFKTYNLAAADYVEVKAWQNSGNARKVMSQLSRLSVTFLGD